MSFDLIVDRILKREGGYVNHPLDEGGPTNYGITQATLSSYQGRQATVDEVKNLSIQIARDIYRINYIVKPRYNLIGDPLLLELAVDFAVHSGSSRATSVLQELVGVKVDGSLGPITANAINFYKNTTALCAEYKFRRACFMLSIIDSKRNFVFAKGWAKRLRELP